MSRASRPEKRPGWPAAINTRLDEMLDGADIDLDKQDWWDLYVAAGNLIP